jgi:hypothetical protein
MQLFPILFKTEGRAVSGMTHWLVILADALDERARTGVRINRIHLKAAVRLRGIGWRQGSPRVSSPDKNWMVASQLDYSTIMIVFSKIAHFYCHFAALLIRLQINLGETCGTRPNSIIHSRLNVR